MDKQQLQSLVDVIKDEQKSFLDDAQHKVNVQMAWFDGRIKQLELLIKEIEKAEQA